MNPDERTIARLYLRDRSEHRVIVNIPGTSYELHLEPTGEVDPTPRGRVWGVIRCRVWKADYVSVGGAFIEPITGRPGLVQGRVTATLPESNAVVVEVADTPFVCHMPERWDAARIPEGARLGLDLYPGATFEPTPKPAAV